MSCLAVHGQTPSLQQPQDVAAWLQKSSAGCLVALTESGLRISRREASKPSVRPPFSIVLTDAAMPATYDRLSEALRAASPDALEFTLAAPPWDKFSLPLDLTAQAILKELPEGQVNAIAVALPPGHWEHDLATLWNLRALVGLLDGDLADRRQARHQFLQEFCGDNAAPIVECFRERERCFMTAAALTVLPNHSMPQPSAVFTLLALEKMTAAMDNLHHPNAYVQAEIGRFQAAWSPILQEHRAAIRQMVPGQAAASFVALHGGAPSVKSTVALTVDAERLWLRLEAEEPNMAERKRNCTRRDDPVWEDDCFEIHLLCEGTDGPEEGYQFIVNSRGTLWDGHRLKTHADDKWNAEGAHVEITETPSSWIVVISMPWRELGLSEPPAAPWRANFYRTRFAGGAAELMAWSPLRVNQYYFPKDFGWIKWQ